MTNKIVIFLLGLIIGVLGVWGWHHMRAPEAPKFDSAFQAVLLDSGQVYYGKIEGLGTEFPVLTDVYYIQSATDPNTKQTQNILIRRGKEWHGPDKTVINARHLVMVEPVGKDSKVAQLIAEQEKQK